MKRARAEALLARAFGPDGAPRGLHEAVPPRGLCAAAAERFFSRGGRFLRPRLLSAVYVRLAPEARDRSPSGGEAAVALMKAVECFHRASLIHDDIQDGAATRYGAKSVHAEHGVPCAIALGDWLVAAGYAFASRCAVAEKAVAAVSRRHLAMCEGQFAELSSARGASAAGAEASLADVCAGKTGSGFALAAELGAVAAGAGNAAEEAAAELGMALGTAYQCIDDLRDGDCPAGREASLRLLSSCRRAALAAAGKLKLAAVR